MIWMEQGDRGYKEDRPLFSEVFYRSEKKFIDAKVKEGMLTTVLMLFGGGVGYLVILYFALPPRDLIDVGVIVGGAGWIIWVTWEHFHTLRVFLTYIVIVSGGLKIIEGNRKLKKFIPKNEIQKITINVRKKRIEIHLKNGKIIYSKRPHRREIDHRILSYDQFERFKRAMKEIGVEYEIIYA